MKTPEVNIFIAALTYITVVFCLVQYILQANWKCYFPFAKIAIELLSPCRPTWWQLPFSFTFWKVMTIQKSLPGVANYGWLHETRQQRKKKLSLYTYLQHGRHKPCLSLLIIPTFSATPPSPFRITYDLYVSLTLFVYRKSLACG